MNKIIPFTLLMISCLCLNAQETVNLKHCLEVGLERNYDIRIVKNEQQISDNNATAGNSGYLPTLDLSAGYSGNLNNTNDHTIAGETIKNSGVLNQSVNAGINLNWTAFDGLNIQSTYSKLKELQKLGALNTRVTVENFISGFSAEYYNYVQQKIRMANLMYAVELSRERLRIVNERYNIGSMSRLDLQQAKVDFNADSSNLIKQYEQMHVSRITLNKMMALDNIEMTLHINDSVIEYNDTLNKEKLWEQVLASNSDLLISEKNKTLSELDLKIAKSKNYPYLKLYAGYGYNYNLYQVGTYDRQQTLGLNYGVTLGFTIFNGNRSREQKNAKIDLLNRGLEQQQLELALKSDLSNIWMAYQNNIELTNLEKENLNVAKEYYEIAIDRYKLGNLSGIELREAQNSLLESEDRLLIARYNTKLCEISLMLISGQIAEYLK